MKGVEILPQDCSAKPNRQPWVYVLECADGSLYTGWTLDLTQRMAAHRRGRASRYTRSRRPVRLVAWWPAPNLTSARSQEARFKRLSRADKTASLHADEAFGCAVRKPPGMKPSGSQAATSAAPSADEVRATTARARDVAVRIATDRGDLVVSLFPDDAPAHVAAFLKLVEAGFYDGLTFHRVEPGFVVQGGDPNGDGTGGPGYRLPAEFNARPHVRGTLAMARAADPDSAGSQFYLCLDDARFLDGQYTVFGMLTDGYETLDAIRRGDVMRRLTVEPRTGTAPQASS
jgi:cyclophilin family peptidyl-prolyl cis-trans isomerase/predicted GIY-YIG superfamily endonuclease